MKLVTNGDNLEKGVYIRKAKSAEVKFLTNREITNHEFGLTWKISGNPCKIIKTVERIYVNIAICNEKYSNNCDL